MAALGFNLVSAADTIALWNFNSPVPDGSSSTGSVEPAIGTGTASALGGVSAGFADGTGSGDPATGDDTGWSISSFATQGTGNLERGVQFAVSTVGYSDIVVRWDQRHSNTAARDVRFQYSVSGLAFVDFGPLLTAESGGVWTLGRTVDLSPIVAANDNAAFVVRIMASFAGGSENYAASQPGSTYGTTGTWRFDMVTISGTAIPVPEAAGFPAGVVLAVGAAVACRRRRRGD